MEAPFNGAEEQYNSCGIKKIVDCKLMNGQQMYKVKWEPTWEPAENLDSCQHLVNEFWSHINTVKTNEEKAQQVQRKMKLDPDSFYNDINMNSLTAENKLNIHQLISCTHSTSVGSTPLLSPSDHFSKDQKPSKLCGKMSNVGKIKNESPMKSGSNNPASPSNLKYLENFDSPYVKVIVVCKVCNKEQSMTRVNNWKQHYFTHTEEKPFPCPHCSRGFIRADILRKHVQSKHNIGSDQSIKEEGNGFVKEEHFF